MKTTHELAFRVPVQVASQIDEIGRHLGKKLPGVRITRSDAARMILIEGIARWEAENGPLAVPQPVPVAPTVPPPPSDWDEFPRGLYCTGHGEFLPTGMTTCGPCGGRAGVVVPAPAQPTPYYPPAAAEDQASSDGAPTPVDPLLYCAGHGGFLPPGATACTVCGGEPAVLAASAHHALVVALNPGADPVDLPAEPL